MSLRKYLAFISEHPVFFLSPYLILYLVGWKIDVKTHYLLTLFDFLNLFHFTFFLTKIPKFFRTFNFFSFCFLFFIFTLTGCYFEYPSDTWAHYERIMRWSRISSISLMEEEVQRKFFYFWEWSLVAWVPISERRILLNALSALSQTLLLVEVFQISLRMRWSRIGRVLHVFVFLATFGYSLFSIRYYGISSTNVAYAVYIFLMGQCLAFEDNRNIKSFIWRWSFPGSLLFLFFNHTPEFIFALILISLTGVICYSQKFFTRSSLNTGILIIFISIVGLNYLLEPPHPLHSISFFTLNGFRAQAIVGLVNLLAPAIAVIFYRNVSSLLLSLSLVALLPGFSTWAEELANTQVNYRIDVLRVHWILPTSLILCVLLSYLEARLDDFRYKILLYAYFVGVVLYVGLQPQFPWRGKLWFQFHQADPQRELIGTTELAEWISKNRNFSLSSTYLSDDETSFALNSHLGWRTPHNRIKPLDLNRKLVTVELAQDWIETKKPAFVLLPIPALIPRALPSKVGTHLSWESHYGDQKVQMSTEFYKAVNGALDKRGWKKVEVPPYYLLRQP